MTIYTEGSNFSSVEGAFCRLIDNKSNKEFCRYNLSNNRDGICNGNIMCNLKRYGKNWSIKSRGYYTKGTTMANDMVPIIK